MLFYGEIYQKMSNPAIRKMMDMNKIVESRH